MSINIIIAIHENICDPLTMGQTDIVSGIFRDAANILANGGKVVVQRQYSNAPPDVLCEFTNEEELSAWKDRLNKVQIILKRPQQIP